MYMGFLCCNRMSNCTFVCQCLILAHIQYFICKEDLTKFMLHNMSSNNTLPIYYGSTAADWNSPLF